MLTSALAVRLREDNPDIQKQSNEAVNQKPYFTAPKFTPHDRSQMMSNLHARGQQASSLECL
jgi:hypothetical protein